MVTQRNKVSLDSVLGSGFQEIEHTIHRILLLVYSPWRHADASQHPLSHFRTNSDDPSVTGHKMALCCHWDTEGSGEHLGEQTGRKRVKNGGVDAILSSCWNTVQSLLGYLQLWERWEVPLNFHEICSWRIWARQPWCQGQLHTRATVSQECGKPRVRGAP